MVGFGAKVPPALSLNDVAVTTPTVSTPPEFAVTAEPTCISLLAVIIPIESTFVTSSYVNVPPTPTFPVTVRLPVMF